MTRSVAEEPSENRSAAISTEDNGTQGFVPLVIASGAVRLFNGPAETAVRVVDHPRPSILRAATTIVDNTVQHEHERPETDDGNDSESDSDCASFVTAADIFEGGCTVLVDSILLRGSSSSSSIHSCHNRDGSSIHSFVTAATGITATASTNNNNDDDDDGVVNNIHPPSTAHQVLAFLRSHWNENSNPSKASTTTNNNTNNTAIRHTTETVKGRISAWIQGTSGARSPFSSSCLAKDVLDSAHDDEKLEEKKLEDPPAIPLHSQSSSASTVSRSVLHTAAGQRALLEGGEAPFHGTHQQQHDMMMSSGPLTNETICIETILDESSSAAVDFPRLVEVVVYGHDRLLSEEDDYAAASNNGLYYICCGFDSWYSNFSDCGYQQQQPTTTRAAAAAAACKGTTTDRSGEVSLGSTQASSWCSTNSNHKSSSRGSGTTSGSKPWYAMPTLSEPALNNDVEPLDDNDNDNYNDVVLDYSIAVDSYHCDNDQRGGSFVSRLGILQELHRFQNGLCSDRVMEMVHFQSSTQSSESIVVLD